MSLVLSEKDADGIVTLTLNDPATLNAISDLPMIEALLASMAAAEADPAARVIVLTGAGSAFSAGGNIKAMDRGWSTTFPPGPAAITRPGFSACRWPSKHWNYRSSPQ